MSLRKFFSTKSRGGEAKLSKSEAARPTSDCAAAYEADAPPNLQNARAQPERMSVSHSGRYKQRERRRSSLFDNGSFNIPEDRTVIHSQQQQQQIYGSANHQRADYDNGNGATTALQADAFGNKKNSNSMVDNAAVAGQVKQQAVVS